MEGKQDKSGSTQFFALLRAGKLSFLICANGLTGLPASLFCAGGHP